MSNPSFSNIDLWLFERAEGNLSPEQLEQLDLFLLRNPELDVDRDMWEMAKVDKHTYVYPEVASLERRRKPVAAFGLMAFFLLFAGTTSYLFWNGTSEVETTQQSIATQNIELKRELFKQINVIQTEGSRRQTNRKTGYVGFDAASDQHAFALNLKDVASAKRNQVSARNVFLSPSITETSSIDEIAFTESHPIENTLLTDVAIDNSNTELQDVAGINALKVEATETTNTDEISTLITSEKKPEELITSEVTEIKTTSNDDPFGGSKWNPNRTRTNVAFTSLKSSYKKPSFKDRLNSFARNLDRMMSSPIALKNSREPLYHVPGLTSSDISFSSAGTLIATRVQTTSRVQWLGRENEQMTNQLSVDGYSSEIRGGWGLQLNHQWYKDGGIQVGQAALTYSPKISVSRFISVEPSVRVKMGNKQLNADQLSDVEMVELERGNEHAFYPNGGSPIGKNLWYKDLGLGMLVNTKWFFAGVQVDNLFKHKDNLYDNNWSDPRRAQNYFTATVGTDWMSRNEKLKFSPYILYQKNERLSEAWAGASFSWNWLVIGAATSTNLEPAASLGIRFDHFSMLYNVDYTQSRMLSEKALSHQVTLRFVGKRNQFRN